LILDILLSMVTGLRVGDLSEPQNMKLECL